MNLNMSLTRAARWCGSALVLALSASCGGGGAQVSNFHAGRVIAFGDENSVLDDSASPGNAQKYGVNGTVSDTDGTYLCTNNPIWVQSVALSFGLVFPQCNNGAGAVANPASRIRATVGAKVADLAAQITAQQADSPFQATDLATVLVGQYDVIAQYAQYPAVGEPQLIANVEAAGGELGRQVNRIADAGGKVVVSTTADVGLTPFALAERAANIDTDRAALLSRLSVRFNASMRATIYNDGRRIGLVLLDEFTQTVAKFPSVGGYSDVTTPVCDLSRSAYVPPSTLDCTGLTLVANTSPVTYLWADGLHLSAGGQASLSNLAVSRALYNPF
jgi:outer membrane lipase/esterase